MSTWADRADFRATGSPLAYPMRCPCCAQMRSADSIYEIPDLPLTIKQTILESGKTAWSSWPAYACTVQLASVHREGMATPEMPGSR